VSRTKIKLLDGDTGYINIYKIDVSGEDAVKASNSKSNIFYYLLFCKLKNRRNISIMSCFFQTDVLIAKLK